MKKKWNYCSGCNKWAWCEYKAPRNIDDVDPITLIMENMTFGKQEEKADYCKDCAVGLSI